MHAGTLKTCEVQDRYEVRMAKRAVSYLETGDRKRGLCRMRLVRRSVSATQTQSYDRPILKPLSNVTRKLSYRKDDRAMRPINGCPENDWKTATFPEICNALSF